MLSKTCEYALRAMIYVAQKSKDGTMVNIKEISEKINSPELFIAKILQGLSKQGFLQSAKGRYGGFYISDKAAEFSLADIVEAIDGDKMFHGCGLGLEFCSETNPCPIHNEYKEARDKIYKIYGKVTLSRFRNEDVEKVLQLRRK
ncbi:MULTISPECIES: RrF2 family transcriptional regulator [Chryseobacterium]|uniref:RrF2 family transcriptional regulator n=1 Tax=Chryseobacterium sp. R2A-55 TaxID=2744445 RepID=UPI001F187951|nr:Rrf2 family transcriptional regulator [Chryseobacterium sp. R2A-55]